MRISVVVIVYNLDAYIAQAIDSVLRQTRKADELIVVDDCSTDRSAEKVKAYGDNVRYVRMPMNSGALLAALTGVKAASGDVISMLDGDDYWASNKLEVVEREFLAEPELMLLSHDHVRVDEGGNPLRVVDNTHRNIATLRRRAKSPNEFSDLLKESILDQRGYWLGSAYSFRSSCFDSGIFESQIGNFGFERLRQTYFDLAIAPFLVLTNPRSNVGYTDDTRFFYRIHDAASMAGKVTPEQAKQAALKGRTINELIDLILRRNHASSTHIKRRASILCEYDYLAALYGGQSGKAARLYVTLAASHWNWRQWTKETQRFLAILIIGPRAFLKLKERQTRT